MIDTWAPQQAVVNGPGRDLIALHAALSGARDVLDMLQVSAFATAGYGADTWMVQCAIPEQRIYAFAPNPTPDDDLLKIAHELGEALGPEHVVKSGIRAGNVIARWEDADSPPVARSHCRCFHAPLLAVGETYGALGIVASPEHAADQVDWPSIETVIAASLPYICLGIQRDAEAARIDSLTGLWTPAELQARVDNEVERARNYPVEFSLVLMGLCMGRSRRENMLTEQELKTVGCILMDTLRSSDCASRLEDGRFAILLPMTNQRNALIALSRVVDSLRRHPDLPVDLECQTGMSGWTFEGASTPELMRQASSALESARSAGASGAFVFL